MDVPSCFLSLFRTVPAEVPTQRLATFQALPEKAAQRL